MATVTEDEIADAMVFLAERAKLVAEGAGAVAVAALLADALPPVAGTTVADRLRRQRRQRPARRRCCCATKPSRAGGCGSTPASPIGPAGSPSCSA